MRRRLRRWLWFAVTAVILALIIYNLRNGPEWRHFDWHRLWTTLLAASPGSLFLALVTVFISHLVRAYRWKFLMAPVKKASLAILFNAQVLGFSSIYLIGRTAELVRPAYISKKENVPASSMFAVLVLERLFDQICLILLFSLAAFALPVEMTGSQGSETLRMLQHAGSLLLVFVAAVVALLAIFRLKTTACTRIVLRLLHFLPERARRHAEHFLLAFSDGLQVVQGARGFLGVAFSTLALWTVNATVIWLVMQSMGGELAALPWLASAIALFVASLGLIIQLPGIGGGYQVGLILALTAVFRVEADVAAGAAILVWLLISIPVFALGVILLIREGLTVKQLEVMSQEERVGAGR